MGDLLRFVDSVAASPTVRLNLNDETTWTTQSFDCPSPSLTRAASRNAMRDGISVASSSYDGRILTIRLLLQRSTQDLSATQVQALARELDREKNILQWQPTGATKPVFFTTYRSSMGNVKQWTTQAATREFEFELLADPFALGLRETLGPYTVNNDPAHATNGCYVDVTGVIGDVEAPCLMVDTGTTSATGGLLYIGRRARDATNMLFRFQGEAKTGGTATNPGGAAVTVYSGSGSSNYVSQSVGAGASATDLATFDVVSGATDAQRIATRGRYRVLLFTKNGNSVSWRVRDSRDDPGFSMKPTVPTSNNTGDRAAIDLGLMDLYPPAPIAGGLATPAPMGSLTLALDAYNSAAGSVTVEVDCFILIPADDEAMIANYGVGGDVVYDGIDEQRAFMKETGADIWAGTANEQDSVPFAGTIPSLVPNTTNRLVVVRTTKMVGDSSINFWPSEKTATTVLTLHYFPRYVNVRPAST